MKHSTLLFLLVGLSLEVSLLLADDEAHFECIVETMLPEYSPTARLAASPGSVEAWVTLAESGGISKLRVESPERNLSDEVKIYLRDATHYSPSCVGKTVHLIYTFELAGKSSDHPSVSIRFRPPNHFYVSSQPKTPAYDLPRKRFLHRR